MGVIRPCSDGGVIKLTHLTSVFLRRTVCDDIDWCFKNLSGSYHQSQVNYESSVDVIRLWLLS